MKLPYASNLVDYVLFSNFLENGEDFINKGRHPPQPLIRTHTFIIWYYIHDVQGTNVCIRIMS